MLMQKLLKLHLLQNVDELIELRLSAPQGI